MTDDSELEQVFLTRLFYKRGGRRLSENFVEAKNLGANQSWFGDAVCSLLWAAAEQLFAEPEFDSISALKVCSRANAIAKRSKDKSVASLAISTDFFESHKEKTGSADSIAGYCDMLRRHSIVRQTLEACQKAREDFSGGDDAPGVAAKLISGVQAVLSGESRKGQVSVADLVDNVISQYQNAYHHVQELGETDYTPGLSLPWKKLSYAMNGFTSVLTVLAARPGVGKTSMAVEMMRYWMDNGVRVVFDSLDMAGVEFMKRQMAELSQVSSRKLQFGKSDRETWEKYDLPAVIAAGERMKQLERDGIFRLYTEPDIDVLKANVKILKDQGKIDVLVVDYIQLMNYRGSEKVSKQQCVSRVSNLLHSITTELDIPVLALSQINRDSSKDGVAPQLHDIKDSGAIEQDATNVIILHPYWTLKNSWSDNPPKQFMRDGDSPAAAKSLMPMWVILAKARDGDSGTEIPFVVVQNKYSWYQADYEADGKDDKFLRVWDNWKHDAIENLWANNGALIRSADRNAIQAVNRRHAAPDRPVETIPPQRQSPEGEQEEIPF